MQNNLLDKKSDLLATPDINRKRYIEIDYAKALGILLVVFGHFVEEFNKKTLGSELGNYIFNWIYCFHMPFFFILSQGKRKLFSFVVQIMGYTLF